VEFDGLRTGPSLVLAAGILACAIAHPCPAAAQTPPSDAAASERPGQEASVAPPLEDAPPEDPALFEPLMPLGEFDVVTQEPSGEAPGGPALIRYRTRFEGLDDPLVASRFRSLSSLQDNRGAATTLGQVAARAELDGQMLQRLMRSEGYYDGVVTTSVEPAADAEGWVDAALTATLGERYRVGEIQITGPATVPEGLAREALTLRTGDPLVAGRVIAAEANVALRLPEQGYPFTDVGDRDVLLDEADRTAAYTLPVDPGPRSSFGGVRWEGDRVFTPGHVATIARFEGGELYDSRMVDDLRRALVATSLFSSVGVEPIRTGEAGPDGTETVALRVIAAAAPPRNLGASAGYGTGEGVRLEASWTHRNLFPPEGALIVRGVAGDKEQRLGATFRRSNAGVRDRTLQVLAEASRERRDQSYDATSLTLAGRLSRDSTPIWRKRWTWSAGAELIGTAETARPNSDTRTYYIAAAPGSVGYDRSDDLLDPRRGFRLLGRVSPEVSLSGGTAAYVRNSIDGSAYFPLGQSTVLAGRARVGIIAGAERSDIAPSRRYYGGGGGSVRGFGFQELGPIDANGERIGGRSIVEFAVEARYRFGDFGIVPFVDAGQASNSVIPTLDDLRFGVGIGARYYTNFGPLRIDLARPVSRRAGEPQVALYVSIGQAF
jgi:translocation and assembly module TamA